jgi:hypothetical protein
VRSVVREIDDYLSQTNFVLKNAEGVAESPGFFYSNAKIASARVDRCEMRVGGVSRAYANNLLVVGDAAGLCDPLTGFGIIYALLSGRAAARTIVEAAAYGDLSVSVLSRYCFGLVLCCRKLDRDCASRSIRYQSRLDSMTRVDFGISKAVNGIPTVVLRRRLPLTHHQER